MNQRETVQSNTIIEQLKGRQTYLSTTEVMAILRVTRQTLCGWVRDGVIPAVRIGKGNVFDPSSLATWLEARSL
jgi:excisionase family DNA binding protein